MKFVDWQKYEGKFLKIKKVETDKSKVLFAEIYEKSGDLTILFAGERIMLQEFTNE